MIQTNPKLRFVLLFLMICTVFNTTSFSSAQDDDPVPKSFVGYGDGMSWDDPFNWMPVCVPDIENSVGIEFLDTVDINSASECHQLFIAGGNSLNVNAPLLVGLASNLGPADLAVIGTLNVNADITVSNDGIFFAGFGFGGVGAMINLNAGTLSTPFLSIGFSSSDIAILNQNGGVLHVSEAAMIQGTATLTIGPNDVFTGAELIVSGGQASILVTSPLTTGCIFCSIGGSFTYEQPDNEITGISVGGNFTISTTNGPSTFHVEFDNNKAAGLHWGLRISGDEQTLLNSYINDGLITTSGGTMAASVIYDPTVHGDFTYVGYVESGEVLLGDINCDGVVNLLDVGPFISLLSNGEFSPKADFNQNGVVNLLDVQPFITVLSGG